VWQTIRIVNSMSEAIAHIDQHSSGHTESIVTENYTSGRRFMSEVDSFVFKDECAHHQARYIFVK
jgi:gamma-glutamyl phosphate reductase